MMARSLSSLIALMLLGALAPVFGAWNATCPSPMTWGGGRAYPIAEYPRVCWGHPVDASVAWKQMAAEVTFDRSHDHNSDEPGDEHDYNLWAHLLIYPEDGPGPDRAMNGVFRHFKVKQDLASMCANHSGFTSCNAFNYQSYGWHQANTSKYGCITSGEPPPHDLFCPLNSSVTGHFCIHAQSDQSAEELLFVDAWAEINHMQISFLNHVPLLNAITGKQTTCAGSAVADHRRSSRPQTTTAASCEGSFAELAAGTTVSPFLDVQNGIGNLNASLLPSDSFIHDYRKSLLLLKNYLDIFAAAYFPFNSTSDPWATLADLSDYGYEIIGDYQDLDHSHVPYTKHDVKTRMGVIQAWRTQMMGNLSVFDFEEYLGHAQEGITYQEHSLSKFFWSGNIFEANAALSGQQNLELLLSEMLDKFAGRYDEVIAYSSIISDENHENFHNVRKSARAVNFLANAFPCIVDNSTAAATSLELLGDLYDRWGDLNDEWTAYDYYVKHGNTTAAAAQKAKVDSDWYALKAWDVSNDMRTTGLLELRTHIAAASAFTRLPPSCQEQLVTGGQCSVRAEDLRPTQFDVGTAEVMGSKLNFFANKTIREIVSFVLSKTIPVVLGPGGVLYQVDGHHTTYAMAWWHRHLVAQMAPSPLRDTLLSIPLVADIMCNWTQKFDHIDEFWAAMINKNWVLLESNGSPRAPDELPSTILGLVDNPYRSLAGIAEIVPNPLIGKGCVSFAEFRWADYYINAFQQGDMKEFVSMGLTASQHDNYTTFTTYVQSSEFQNLTQASAAQHLPGYVCPGGKPPPIPSCPWNATCDA